MIEVGLTPFRVGHCRHPEAMTIRGGAFAPAIFPALAVLIRHPAEGPILFDTGYDPAFVAATEPFPERLYRWATPPSLAPGEALAEQLTAAGVAPGDIRHLVLSHFHADHVAGLHRFPRAAIHCARAGLSVLRGCGRLAATRRGLLPALVPPDVEARARFFEDAPRVALGPDLSPFEAGADLLGDGSLLAVELPGHCPAHFGLLVREAGAGRHFLVADAAWSMAAIREDRPPPRLTATLLGDAAAGRETLNRLHRLHRRNPDIRLTPSHCAESARGWLTCRPA